MPSEALVTFPALLFEDDYFGSFTMFQNFCTHNTCSEGGANRNFLPISDEDKGT